MAIDLNQTYNLLQVMEQSFPPQTLFRDTFFPNEQTFPTKTVLMDYKKGTRKMSPFITNGGSGVNVARGTFKTESYEPPMMAPKRATTPIDLENRSFGENVFSTQTPAQRAMQLRARDIAELIDMNTRRTEWMCAELMKFGKFEVQGYADDGKTVIIDTVEYKDWTQKLTLTGTDMWTDTNADMYGQLQTMHTTISRNSGRAPDVAIGSDKTCQKILKNASMMQILSIPNAQNLSIMSIQPRIVSPGVKRVGYIHSLDLEIYAYDGIYEDDAGAVQQYIPDGYFIMGVSGRGSQLFGAVTQLDNDGEYRTYEGKNVPKVWSEQGQDMQQIRVASKCVPKPEYIDDWFTLKAY